MPNSATGTTELTHRFYEIKHQLSAVQQVVLGLSHDSFSLLQTVSEILMGSGLTVQQFEKHALVVDIGAPETPGKLFALRIPLYSAETENDYWKNTPILVGIGVAQLLKDSALKTGKCIRIIFELVDRAEENSVLTDSGVLKNVSSLIELSVSETVPDGFIGFKNGVVSPLHFDFSITIRKKSSKSDRNNLIAITANLITAITQIPARKINPLYPSDVSFHTVKSIDAENGTTQTIKLTGGIRTEDDPAARLIFDWIARHLATSEVYNLEIDFNHRLSLDSTKQSENVLTELRKSAVTEIGSQRIVRVEFPADSQNGFRHHLNFVRGAIIYLGKAPFSHPDNLPLSVESAVRTLAAFYCANSF